MPRPTYAIDATAERALKPVLAILVTMFFVLTLPHALSGDLWGRAISALWAGLSLVLVALITQRFWGSLAAIIAAIGFGVSAPTLITASSATVDTRALLFGLIAVLVTLERRTLWAAPVWFIAFLLRPRATGVLAVFSVLSEISMQTLSLKVFRRRDARIEMFNVVAPIVLAACGALAILKWSGFAADSAQWGWFFWPEGGRDDVEFANDRFTYFAAVDAPEWTLRRFFGFWIRQTGLQFALPALVVLTTLIKVDPKIARLFDKSQSKESSIQAKTITLLAKTLPFTLVALGYTLLTPMALILERPEALAEVTVSCITFGAVLTSLLEWFGTGLNVRGLFRTTALFQRTALFVVIFAIIQMGAMGIQRYLVFIR